jgi:hypothetical protein
MDATDHDDGGMSASPTLIDASSSISTTGSA